MATEYIRESADSGCNDVMRDMPRTTLSSDQAQALLRLCSMPSAADRTYSNVSMLATPNGASLYVKANLFG